jgi:hypothetical protein
MQRNVLVKAKNELSGFFEDDIYFTLIINYEGLSLFGTLGYASQHPEQQMLANTAKKVMEELMRVEAGLRDIVSLDAAANDAVKKTAEYVP